MNPQHWEYVYLLQGRLDNSVGLYYKGLSLCMSRVKNYAVNRTPPPFLALVPVPSYLDPYRKQIKRFRQNFREFNLKQ